MPAEIIFKDAAGFRPVCPFFELFRSINVGGHHRVKMADLKALFEELSFKDVRTYVQSGIVAKDIERFFEKRFGFAARVMSRRGDDGTKLHVVILNNTPPEATLAALAARAQALSGVDAEDRYIHRGTVLYLHTPNGLGRSKLAETVMRTLSDDATLHSWRTVLALQDLAQQTGAS